MDTEGMMAVIVFYIILLSVVCFLVGAAIGAFVYWLLI
jgi:hypothetical protein